MSNIKKTNKVHPNNEALEILRDIINRSVWLKQVRRSIHFTEVNLKELKAIDRKYEKLSKRFLQKCEDDLKSRH